MHCSPQNRIDRDSTKFIILLRTVQNLKRMLCLCLEFSVEFF